MQYQPVRFARVEARKDCSTYLVCGKHPDIRYCRAQPNATKDAGKFATVSHSSRRHTLGKGSNAGVHAGTHEEITPADHMFDFALTVRWSQHKNAVLIQPLQFVEEFVASFWITFSHW